MEVSEAELAKYNLEKDRCLEVHRCIGSMPRDCSECVERGLNQDDWRDRCAVAKQGPGRKDRDEKHKTKETMELNKISGELHFNRLSVQAGANLDNTKPNTEDLYGIECEPNKEPAQKQKYDKTYSPPDMQHQMCRTNHSERLLKSQVE